MGHGSYSRQVWDWQHTYTIQIKRWYCQVCRRTISILPSFLLSHRRYTLAVIQSFLLGHYEDGHSWRQLEAALPASGIARSSRKRWSRSFGEQAARWRAEVERTLAEHDSGSPLLNALGEAEGEMDGAGRLIQASMHLLAWAKTCWEAVETYGLNDRLRFLWHWGHGKKLGRLI